MKAILPQLNEKSKEPLYLQLFNYLKTEITSGEIVPGEKLPSLRNLSETLSISLTTVQQAYAQLEVEGYIDSRPRSGYKVNELYLSSGHDMPATLEQNPTAASEPKRTIETNTVLDLSTFDFVKWKKCVSKVLTDRPEVLLFEGEPQGEYELRKEISKYVYSSRGVRCTPDQVVIAAGIQQTTSLLANILKEMSIFHIAVEDPGYTPVTSSFSGRGFALAKTPVAEDGLVIEKLPANISCAAYVSPSNQFPTGALMPISRRYMLLDWAVANNSYIMEDDYDSELRYTGRPLPALQGLDGNGRVIYLGSFSSTLFASIRISYMVLPHSVKAAYDSISHTFAQTCSKTEQLALALFMKEGHYGRGIKKLRRLGTRKLRAVLDALEGAEGINAVNTSSGINITLTVDRGKSPIELCNIAGALGIFATPLEEAGRGPAKVMLNYFRLPLEDISKLIEALLKKW